MGGVLAWPLGWGDPGEQPQTPQCQAPVALGSMPVSDSQQGLLPKLTRFNETKAGRSPQMLQGHNFLQAARAVLRILQKAWGPWALEARPAKGWGGRRGC